MTGSGFWSTAQQSRGERTLFYKKKAMYFLKTFRSTYLWSKDNFWNWKINLRFFFFCSGNWSKLQIEFTFVRNSIIFIPAMYFPCAMVVFISWITFLMETTQYPARTYLCVTSLLTIITLQTALNSSLPKVFKLWKTYIFEISKDWAFF